MALHLEIVKNLSGFSLAKYSTWLYYKSDHILFDAGEGVSIAMRNRIYAVDAIFLSHGHGDHTGGLPGFICSRASSMGDQAKPLYIYYPEGERNIQRLRKYITEAYHNYLPFEIIWRELSDGARIPLSKKRELIAFASRHQPNTLSLGYKVVEYRQKLKEEYGKLPQEQLVEHIKKYGREQICDSYRKTLLCYSGDSMPLDLDIVDRAEVLIHDATFLRLEDRVENTHATLQETMNLAKEGKVSALGLFHFSGRYGRQEIIDSICRNVKQTNIDFPVFFLLPYFSPASFKKVILEDANNNGNT